VRAGLALIVLLLNILALASIFGTRRGAVRRLRWTAGVVFLPLIGAVGWFAVGRRRAGRRAR
jgi:hypothetical protein